jgi:hypothetical protein
VKFKSLRGRDVGLIHRYVSRFSVSLTFATLSRMSAPSSEPEAPSSNDSNDPCLWRSPAALPMPLKTFWFCGRGISRMARLGCSWEIGSFSHITYEPGSPFEYDVWCIALVAGLGDWDQVLKALHDAVEGVCHGHCRSHYGGLRICRSAFGRRWVDAIPRFATSRSVSD